jgi:hypothetical protein
MAHILKSCGVLVILSFLTNFMTVEFPPPSAAYAEEHPELTSEAAAVSDIPAVVYQASDGHIHELALRYGTWQHQDLSVAAGGAPSSYDLIAAIRRGDGAGAIYYKGSPEGSGLSHIYEIRLEGGRWQWSDLTTITGGAHVTQWYGADAYARADGKTAVVFWGGQPDLHIQEYRLDGTWISSTIDSTVSYNTDCEGVSAYVRSDNISSVVYSGDSPCDIFELRQEGGWQLFNLTLAYGRPYNPGSTARGYARSDGVSSVVYAPDEGQENRKIYELWLGSEGWQFANLWSLAGAPRAWNGVIWPYVRGDGINAVVYTTKDNRLGEIRLDNGWKYADLPEHPYGLGCYEPRGYVRADGVTAVACRYFSNAIWELRLTGGGWIWSNLTSIAGAPDTNGRFDVYNRGFDYRVALPLVIRG